jgi:hypothetical protein
MEMKTHISEIETIDNIINIVDEKKRLVSLLINVLKNTNSYELRKKALLCLVDNFKDERIIPILKELILSPDFKESNAIFVYALGEYSSCKEDLVFLTEVFLNQDYHVAWNVYNIIQNLNIEFDRKSMTEALELLKSNINVNDDKMDMHNELIEIFSFYINDLNT